MDLVPYLQEHGGPVLRLLLAAALGGVIGLERKASGKPAGFRTNLLICMGAALLTEVSVYVARDVQLPGGFRADPGRIAAQVVSGIGFLGAGTILRSRGSVTGLTTAATLWVVAAIGIAIGASAYTPALAGTVLVLVALRILGRLEGHGAPPRAGSRMLRAQLEPGPDVVGDVERAIAGAGFSVVAVDVEKGETALSASFETRGTDSEAGGLIGRLLQVPGVRRVTLE